NTISVEVNATEAPLWRVWVVLRRRVVQGRDLFGREGSVATSVGAEQHEDRITEACPVAAPPVHSPALEELLAGLARNFWPHRAAEADPHPDFIIVQPAEPSAQKRFVTFGDRRLRRGLGRNRSRGGRR